MISIAMKHIVLCCLCAAGCTAHAWAQPVTVLPAAMAVTPTPKPDYLKDFYYYAYAEDLQAKWRLHTSITSHAFIKGRYVEQYDSLKSEWLKVVQKEKPDFKGAVDIRMSQALPDLEREWENYNHIAQGRKFAIHTVVFPQ